MLPVVAFAAGGVDRCPSLPWRVLHANAPRTRSCFCIQVPSNMAKYHVYAGSFVHSSCSSELELITAAVVVDAATGTITRIDDLSSVGTAYSSDEYQVHRLQDRQFMVPGFVDTHVHAPQYKFTGTGTGLPLFEWLDTYTFPTESGMADLSEAKECYSKMITRLLANGTTTSVYYATLDPEPTKLLVDLLHQQGQRAIVGKVSMDRNAPGSYVRSTAQDLAEAREVVEHVLAKGTARLMPCVVPRFIPTCTPELMNGLAELAQQHGAYVQSHISESWAEANYVRSLHPEAPHDAHVFAEMGLLTSKAVMAHGTMLSDDEIRQLAAAGVCLAHCPLSNFFFGDAPFRVKHALSLGLKVGLGTDIAGGYSPSMLSAMRAAVVNSQVVRMQRLQRTGFADVNSSADGQEVLSFKEAFWMATLGGAEALGLGHLLGSFAAGKQFDALLVDCEPPGGGPFDVFAGDTWAQRFEKFINLGDDRNVMQVYVDGRRVVG